MTKIAILGAESSHACFFSSVLAPKEGEKKYYDLELLGVFADFEDERTVLGIEKIKQQSECVVFAKHYDDFLEEADAIMITTANGNKHFKYAKPYIKKGIPVWIDKPISCSPPELIEMWDLAQKHNSILCGGSTLEFVDEIQFLANEVKTRSKQVIGGHLTAPLVMENLYGGFWFYSPHLVQMMTTVFGTDVRSVRAEKTPQGVSAVYSYKDFNVTAFYGTGYSATVYVDDWSSKGGSFELSGPYLRPLENFYNIIKNGKTQKNKKEFIASTFIIDATIKSYAERQEIKINIPD